MNCRFRRCWLLLLVCLPAWSGANVGRAADLQAVNLPYSVSDSQGNQWRIYANGMLQNQGNMPMYSQGAVLMINNNAVPVRRNQAMLDPQSGEIVVENLPLGELTVTRRILVDREQGLVRYVDIFHNPQNKAVTQQIRYQSNINYGIQNARTVTDPRHKELNLGWSAMTGGNKAIFELYAGKGSKLTPSIQWEQGNNAAQAAFSITVNANADLAIVHLHGIIATQEAGAAFITDFKESKLLKSLPTSIRKIVANFSNATFLGDYELLRGDLFDIVELRGGDQYKGTLQVPSYTLLTAFGELQLPADKIIGILNTGTFRPRQLLVSADGEIFGGTLKEQTIALQLTSGQTTQIPLAQISRIGYRKRPGETDDPSFTQPRVVLRSGDRVGIEPPAGPITFVTRYGALQLQPALIAAIMLQGENLTVHELLLTDGSRIWGLVERPTFEAKLTSTGQVAKFPLAAIAQLQFAAQSPDEPDADAPTLRMVNQDLLVGVLAGQLKLDTPFDTLAIEAAQIKRLVHVGNSPQEVQITLWDDTTLSGQLQSPQVPCQLVSGITLPVPVSLIEQYNQPLPATSAAAQERIRRLVADLSAQDWKVRDRAETQLISMGVAVMGQLRELRNQQPPEAQQRIDSILQQLAKSNAQTRADVPSAAAAA